MYGRVALALAVTAVLARGPGVPASGEIAVGKEAPEIEGQDLDGVTFRLSDYRGKVVLLDFWGHW